MEVEKKQNNEESETEENSNSYINAEPDYSVLKQIILLHTKTAWKHFIIISTVILQFHLILYDISFRGRTSFPPQSNDLTNEKLALDSIYAFDVFCAIIYKKSGTLSSTYGQPARPITLLIVDVISLLPIDMVYRLLTNTNNSTISYLLSTNRLLRIHRLISLFSTSLFLNDYENIANVLIISLIEILMIVYLDATRNTVGQGKVFVRVLEFLILLFLMTGIAVAGMIRTVDMVNLTDLNWLKIIEDRSSYPKNEFEWCIISYYVMMTLISGHGIPEIYPGIYSLAFIFIVLITLWILQAFEVAYLTDIILQQDYSRSLFHREMRLISKYLKETNASKETRDKLKGYYNYFWKTQGNSEFKIMQFKMYPSIFLKECALELSWDAYKHSHLFRDQPVQFLRNLAVYFEREYYRPGELIIQKYDRKSKFIYVVSGVVQILSEEDDKSPILSFSGGTIFCESTLILSHRSLCNVVARTEVDLHVLHRDKFVELMVYRYQSIYRNIQSRIRLRYWKALRMVTIGSAIQKNKSHIVNIPACTDIAWLKQTLTVLQSRQNRISARKDKKDIQSDAIFAATDFRYTFANLDMLVISDDIAIMTQQVCLNNGKIPCIFYPKSTILNYWNGFILICCFALSLIIPTYVSQPQYQVIEVSFFVNFLCSMYLVDLIITSSTAIHENDMVHADVIDIISRRMYNSSYWADVIAAFPIDWILSVSGSHDAELLAYCKINRLVKIYKFEGCFSALENRMILSSFKIRVIKYTFYMMIVTYFCSACILLVTCPKGECKSSGWLESFITNPDENMKGMLVTSAFLYASQVLVGIGTDIIVPKVMLEYFITIPLLVIGAAIFNYVISSIAASQILGGFTKSWLSFNTKNIALILNLNKVTKTIQTRVFQYLEMEWLDNNAYVLTFDRQIFQTATPKLKKQLNAERLASLIREVDLFCEMEDECIEEICSVCKLSLLPPREVVGYRGNECRVMYIVEKGHCQIWRSVDAAPIDVSKGKALYVIEMLTNLKNLHTVTTVTHVSIGQIVLGDLMRVLAQFPEEKTILMKTLKKFKTSDEYARLLTIENTLPRKNMMNEIENNWQPITELGKTKTDPKTQNSGKKTTNNIVPIISERNSWKETVLTFFLLKSTINPCGKFIKIWEAIRCSCAYLMITLYAADAVISQMIPMVPILIMYYALNFMMVIDLYMQLHVQFYNNHRILVTHPLLTAKNYMKKGLIVDVVAVFPFEYFFISRDNYSPQKLWLCRLNKLLMTHRIVGALRYYYSWPYMSRYINCMMFLPLMMLSAHVFACGLLLELCDVGDTIKESENFAAGIYCSPDNVKIKYTVEDPITPIEMYVYSVLYIFATITKIGVVNLNPITYLGILYVLLMTLVSFVLLMLTTTYTVSTISRRDATLTAYQEQMMIMMSYLKETKVSMELRDQVVNYFENFWILKRGTSIMKQMRLFPPALREDVLWCVYGPSLAKSPGFSTKNESFFRSFFNHMEVKFYSKGTEIMTVNLIHRLVYFIHWGWAEAFGPDGTRISVLGCGSIFGNFTGSSTMRQTCSIVTRTHVEAIVIESTDFFDLMMRHPETKKSFLSAMALNTDYLKAETEAEEIEVVSQTRKEPTNFILLPNTRLVETWEIFSVLFSCYFAFTISLYDVAITNFHSYWLIIPYSTDFAFILKIGLVFFTAFEDDLGDYVTDKTLIAKRFRESKFGLYLHIFTIIPFEILFLFFADIGTRSNIFAWLRMNRVLRLILVVNYFSSVCNRLNINITLKRIFYTAVLLVSLLHCAACLMMITKKATNNSTPFLEGLEIYIENFYIVLVMFAIISPRTITTNIQEALCLILIFIVFYLSHGILLGEVCAVVDVNQYIMNEYERKITFFKDQVTRMDLTYFLRMNAWSYGSKLWKLRRGQQTPCLIREAPIYLQYAVLNEMYSHHLLENEIFGKLHEDFIRQLTYHFKDSLFFPGDRIVNIGDIDETMYFIDKGNVDVTDDDEHKLHIQTLGPGGSFGIVQGLYERIAHSATYTAKTTTHIIYLHRLHWNYLLKYFPVTTVNLYRSATQIIRSNESETYT